MIFYKLIIQRFDLSILYLLLLFKTHKKLITNPLMIKLFNLDWSALYQLHTYTMFFLDFQNKNDIWQVIQLTRLK